VKVLVAPDGSQYGRWAIEWLACLPFIPQPLVRVLHVLDLAWLHAPFVVPPVMARSDRSIRAEI